MMARRLARLGSTSWRKALAPTRGVISSVSLVSGGGSSSMGHLRTDDDSYYSLQSARAQSTNANANVNATPSYQVFGENTAFTVKAIAPEFRLVGEKTVVLDAGKKGRLLFEWVQRNNTAGGKFAWDRPIRFALSAEEAGLVMARLANGEKVEVNRQTRAENSQYSDVAVGAGALQKVFRATPHPDGCVQFIIDYELNGQGGQAPPTANEATGPLEISLMVGEYQVIKSIIEYSMPRLVGWVPMMDHSISQSFAGGQMKSPHNYSGNRGGGGGGFGSAVPF